MKPTYFSSAQSFRTWLAKNARDAAEFLVGFHKVGSGRPSMTWSEAVDQALCFGWIDGVRKRVDDDRYTIRFTPRKRGSTWSAVNIAKVAKLEALGLMAPAGRAAAAKRKEAKSRTYSYERRAPALLAAGDARRLKAEPGAWKFFQEQAPSYQRRVVHGIVGAKQEPTRVTRLRRLIAACKGRRRL
jgi:uncharacterized protein YdeI (YjbR/CyaY-like superfamily)